MATPATAAKTLDTYLHNLATKPDLVPDYTELMTPDHDRALLTAFVREHVDKNEIDVKTILNFDQQETEIERHMKALLPEDEIGSYIAQCDLRGTMRWIREEIAYRLGVEVGRRLAGGTK